ncbi:hypothetical protein B7R21_09925 [Subtercola boreus]|uniref:Uncharacterized protein n=1 Tax=Subtercola boreus TaxID=120213 RepID=A0A3E0VTG0_9MICO|nr:hypothetical protein B7R21_09925 [Subtercola boreus]
MPDDVGLSGRIQRRQHGDVNFFELLPVRERTVPERGSGLAPEHLVRPQSWAVVPARSRNCRQIGFVLVGWFSQNTHSAIGSVESALTEAVTADAQSMARELSPQSGGFLYRLLRSSGGKARR